MWLINSSIGRKVVMSVTGVALILFLTFHMSMNVVALFSEEGYNMICEFLGANWYALVATAALGFLTILHIVFAFWLTMQNRKARGGSRYAVTATNAKVEWASQNMLVLGIIVVLGILLHLWNFWYNMMFAELSGIATAHAPADGFAYIVDTFSCPVYVVLYIVWLAAIWFHLSHGFWSAMQTLGLNNKTWFCRWKAIGIAYVTLLMLGFVAVVLAFAFKLAPSLSCADNACKANVTECVEHHHKGMAPHHKGMAPHHKGMAPHHKGMRPHHKGAGEFHKGHHQKAKDCDNNCGECATPCAAATQVVDAAVNGNNGEEPVVE